MGFFDKVKSMVNAVTGGAATVTIELQQTCVFPGDPVKVKVMAMSTGAEVQSKGVFIDVWAEEKASLRDEENKKDVSQSKTTVQQTVQIAPAFTLGANETKSFEGSFILPTSTPPSYVGTFAQHTCYIRGRIEAFGNDPDSGYQKIMVGNRG